MMVFQLKKSDGAKYINPAKAAQDAIEITKKTNQTNIDLHDIVRNRVLPHGYGAKSAGQSNPARNFRVRQRTYNRELEGMLAKALAASREMDGAQGFGGNLFEKAVWHVKNFLGGSKEAFFKAAMEQAYLAADAILNERNLEKGTKARLSNLLVESSTTNLTRNLEKTSLELAERGMVDAAKLGI